MTDFEANLSGTGILTLDVPVPRRFSVRMSGELVDRVRLYPAFMAEPTAGVNQYRVILVDQNGNQNGEVESAQLGPIMWAVNGKGTFQFTTSADDPKIEDLTVTEQEVQVWRNGKFLWWGVIYRARADVTTVQFQCYTVEWYFDRRVVGVIPRVGHFEGVHFEYGTFHWAKRHYPGTEPTGHPLTSIENFSIAGADSMLLMPSGEKVTTEEAGTAAWFTTPEGTTLSSLGKSSIADIMDSAVGKHIHIQVHAAGDKDTDTSDRISQAQAEAIATRMNKLDPAMEVDMIGMGKQRPVDRTDTPGGLAANRRILVRYLNADALKGHGQFVSQSFETRISPKDKHKLQATLRGWFYFDSIVAPAINHWGLVIELQDLKKPHKNPALAAKGYTKVYNRQYIPFTRATVKRRWMRVEVSLNIPNDGHTYRVEGRIFPPAGAVYCDEVDMFTNDSLDFVNVEQADIMRALVNHAQDESIGKTNLNIRKHIRDTGVQRTRRSCFSERQVIGEALNEVLDAGRRDGMGHRLQRHPPNPHHLLPPQGPEDRLRPRHGPECAGRQCGHRRLPDQHCGADHDERVGVAEPGGTGSH